MTVILSSKKRKTCAKTAPMGDFAIFNFQLRLTEVTGGYQPYKLKELQHGSSNNNQYKLLIEVSFLKMLLCILLSI